MFAALKRTSDPGSEPVTTAEAKTHLRVDHSADDTYIDGLVAAARIAIEEACSRAMITQTWEVTFNGLCGDRLRIPRPPIVSVSSVEYRDSNGTLQTVSTDDYEVDTDSEPAVIRFITTPAYDTTYLNPIRVTFSAGYGAASAVPQTLKHAIKLLVGHFYENRESVVNAQGVNLEEMPQGVRFLISNFKFKYS